MDDGLLPASQRRVAALEARVRELEKFFDTRRSAFAKRIWWRIDGYPPWYINERRRKRRPWHSPSQGRRSTDPVRKR
jgi:hypothetical protein